MTERSVVTWGGLFLGTHDYLASFWLIPNSHKIPGLFLFCSGLANGCRMVISRYMRCMPVVGVDEEVTRHMTGEGSDLVWGPSGSNPALVQYIFLQMTLFILVTEAAFRYLFKVLLVVAVTSSSTPRFQWLHASSECLPSTRNV
jgi:hypothetical protein